MMRRMFRRLRAQRRRRRADRIRRRLYGDNRRPNNGPFCSDCPDHEACATGWPCYEAHMAQRQAR